MKLLFLATPLAILGSLAVSVSASAASLPGIKTSSSNVVPECVTPGRLTAFLQSRNPNMPSRYDDIAVDYMRHGEDLGVRWDYGFFQMLVETANLRYTGTVRAKQNNFAGLGATGGGVRGESFRSVSKGVRAHLQHVLMYTGTQIEDPVAERTRKVQAWGVLDKWRKRIRGPMTYTHLTQKWSPGDRGYSRDIAAIGNLFFSNFCKKTDPNPGLLAKARGGTKKPAATTVQTAEVKVVKTAPSGLGASKAGDTVKKAGSDIKVAKADSTSGDRVGRFSSGNAATGGKIGNQQVAVLNAPKKDQVVPFSDKPKPDKETKPDTKTDTAAKPKTSGNCKVWTASYGGPKALIIKAVKKGVINYTVLDVNEGREKREATAYIAAYAKGGETVGEFPSPEKALKQAFQLCPEG